MILLNQKLFKAEFQRWLTLCICYILAPLADTNCGLLAEAGALDITYHIHSHRHRTANRPLECNCEEHCTMQQGGLLDIKATVHFKIACLKNRSNLRHLSQQAKFFAF